MKILFKSATTKNDDGWQILHAGKSNDGESYVVTTHNLHSTDVPEECQDSKSTAELVAKLLNEYYANK
jgi:hypothetical protein